MNIVHLNHSVQIDRVRFAPLRDIVFINKVRVRCKGKVETPAPFLAFLLPFSSN